MSFFRGLMGGKKCRERGPTTQDAISRLKETVNLLEKKTTHIEEKVKQEIRTAKENGLKNKRNALVALKRKRRLEKQLLQIDGTISTLEFQMDALESANTNVEVLGSMKFASDALKDAQIDPDDAHDMIDEIAEQKEIQDEINEVFSSFASSTSDYDDDGLLAELEELEREDVENKYPERGQLDELPEAPNTKLPSKSREKISHDDGMKELEAWAM